MSGTGALLVFLPVTIELAGVPSTYIGKPIYLELACRGSFFYLSSSAWARGTADENGTAMLTARVLTDKDFREETRHEEIWNAPVGAEMTLDVFIDGDGDGELITAGIDIRDTNRLVRFVNEQYIIALNFNDLEAIAQ